MNEENNSFDVFSDENKDTFEPEVMPTNSDDKLNEHRLDLFNSVCDNLAKVLPYAPAVLNAATGLVREFGVIRKSETDLKEIYIKQSEETVRAIFSSNMSGEEKLRALQVYCELKKEMSF